MAQLKVKQISDFVTAVGTIHNGVVGTGTATAIGGAKSEAISSAISADVVVLSSAKSYADVAESDAVTESTRLGNLAYDKIGDAATAEANASAYADGLAVNYDSIGSADAALASAKSHSDIQKGRIDALLLDSQGTLDTFKEISDFITTLDTADVDGLTAAISTGDSTALSSAISADVVVLSSAKSYADAAESDAVTESTRLGNLAYDKIGDAAAALASAKTYADTAESDAVTESIRLGNLAYDKIGDAATAEANASAYADGLAVNYDGAGSAAAALASAKTYADTAESDAITSANGYTDIEIASVQSQISDLAGVNSDEVIATFVDVRSFDAGKVFNLNGGHVAVFVNGLQIHEAAEGVDGWSSANGQIFTVAGLGYDLEGDDHIVVSGTLA